MILDFEDNKSIFRETIDRKNDSLKFNNKTSMSNTGFENQFYVRKDFENNKIEKIITNSQIDYSLPITEKLNWKILSENKKIASYNTQKAVVEYGGRNWVAWFTTEIPINDGPYIFNGLPGLIVAIEDSNKEYIFNLINVKKSKNIFNTKTKTIKIDWKKFEYLAKSYFDDPTEMNNMIGKTITVFDAKGNQVDKDIFFKDYAKDRQNFILKNNNPIELSHKISYK